MNQKRLPLTSKYSAFGAIFLIFLNACAPKNGIKSIQTSTPVLIKEDDHFLKKLYESYWFPPLKDSDTIRVALADGQETISFGLPKKSKIRIYEDGKAFDVLSPKGVTWQVSQAKVIRPPVVTYFASVATHFQKPRPDFLEAQRSTWSRRKVPAPQWVGAPSNKNKINASSGRWLLSLGRHSNKTAASAVCAKVKRIWRQSCEVIARTELPPLGQAVLKALNSNFQRTFTGHLEILTPKSYIEFSQFRNPKLAQSSSKIQHSYYGPRIFVTISQANKIHLIQETTLANYLNSVVPSEIYPEAHPQALAAQAIIARTYTLKHIQKETGLLPYNICASPACQNYRGLKLNHLATSLAVKSTQGLLLWANKNTPAQTYYHSHCGGQTESVSDAFFMAQPKYLKSVSDHISQAKIRLKFDDDIKSYIKNTDQSSFCSISKFSNQELWNWKKTFNQKQLFGISRSLQLAQPIVHMEVVKRGQSGRATHLKLKTRNQTKIIKGELKIRQLFGGLRSSLFYINLEKNLGLVTQLEILGRGYGHGVGMCQHGAIGRAQEGQSYIKILKAYYPGTFVGQIGWTDYL